MTKEPDFDAKNGFKFEAVLASNLKPFLVSTIKK